jgi:hypothetical protein
MKKVPSIHWKEAFPSGVLDTSVLGKVFPSGKAGLKMLLIALDTEYQGGIDGAGLNRCLCYSFAVYDVESDTYNEGVIYPDWTVKERLSLAFILERICESLGITGRGIDRCHIILVAHFFAAELSMLKDRSKVVKRLEYMHKSAISRGALSFHWYNSCRNKVSITLDVKDTMLLLPASHLSLQKASAFVDEPKGTLSEHEISNMFHLLVTDKERFEEYAIKDARITLKLFVKLQYYLNHLNGTKSKVYSTLSSASIGKYLSYLYDVLPSKDESSIGTKSYLFPKKEDDKGELYRKYEDLAKRAYLGGLNASYNIGTFDDGVYLDMDFSSAYPTVMNMLNAPDFGEIPPSPSPDSDVIDMSDLEVTL